MSSSHYSQPFTTQAEFDHLASQWRQQGFTHAPVVRETLADLDTPLSTYMKLADQPYSYLFESVQGSEKWGRYSIIGLACQTVFKVVGDQLITEVDGVERERQQVADPLTALTELQARYRVVDYPGLPDMIGGLVGYFGYEIVEYIEARLALASKPDPLGCPEILLMLSSDVIVFDSLSSTVLLVTLADVNDPQAWQKAQARLDSGVAGLGQDFAPPHTPVSGKTIREGDYRVDFPQADFEAAVDRCRDYIREGDIMQVVLSQRLSAPYQGNPLDVYRALRTINPSPYMYYLNLGEFNIVGSSPEILVRLQGDTVTVRPIAGTRKRGDTVEKDRALETDLLSDEKELAEHLMLIDLGRNDVGRIAKIGSVQLTEKMQVERYSHVMHIVSNVDARLAPGHNAMDVLRATFPAGTVSGAPKIRAMEIIHELEPIKRGVYSGAVGYIGWNGSMDTAIAIRTAVIKDGTLTIQAGAGIVADSVPEYEWKETMNKARAMFKAVELANGGLQVGH